MKVIDALNSRRAFRALTPFDPTNEIITELAKAAQLAPSCFNKQPWRYVFISDQDSLKEFQSVIPDGNSWVNDSSLIIAVVSEVSLDCKMKDGREYYLFDTGIASGFMMLRATELGLVAHPIAGYDYEKAKELLNIPSEMNLINIIVVGKHNENYKNIFDKEKIESEENRPPRKELSEFAYINKYGNPFK
ncbi:MAG: nitroreductase family protein [Candidatus Delongbacteria bacterium]|jgi:nitroreductase|nr:nitroreductase family protein [Candidatus Delongbacteria bacterium]